MCIMMKQKKSLKSIQNSLVLLIISSFISFAIACSETKKEVKQNIPDERTTKFCEESILNRIDSSFVPSYSFIVPFDSANLIKLIRYRYLSLTQDWGPIRLYNIINADLKFRINSKKKHRFICLEFPYQKMLTGSVKEFHQTLLIFDTTTFRASYIMWLNQPSNYQFLKNYYSSPSYEWGIDDWTDTIISTIPFSEIRDMFPKFKGVVCNKILDSIVIPDIYDFELKPGGYERFLDSIYLKFRFPKRPLTKGQEPSSGLYP